MSVQQRFDFRRPDFETRCIDHAFESVDHEEITILIDPTKVPGAQEPFAIERDEGFFVGLGLVPVPLHDGRTVNDDLPGFALGEFGQRARVDNPGIHAYKGDPQTLTLGPLGWIDMGGRHGLRHAIALDVGQSQQPVQARGDRFRHRSTSAIDPLNGGQVKGLQFGMGQQIHHHGSDQAERIDAMAGDASQRDIAVPARQHDHRGAQIERPIHAALHARDMKKGQRCEEHRFVVGAEPGERNDSVVHDTAMRMHATLRIAGRA